MQGIIQGQSTGSSNDSGVSLRKCSIIVSKDPSKKGTGLQATGQGQHIGTKTFSPTSASTTNPTSVGYEDNRGSSPAPKGASSSHNFFGKPKDVKVGTFKTAPNVPPKSLYCVPMSLCSTSTILDTRIRLQMLSQVSPRCQSLVILPLSGTTWEIPILRLRYVRRAA